MRAALLLLCGVVAADDAGIAKAREIARAGPAAAREAAKELIEIGKGSAWERFAARDALVVAGPPALARLIGEAGGNPGLRLLLEGVSFDLGAGVVAPALPLLSSEDARVRAMAAVSLGAAGKGGEAAVKQLVAALHDKDGNVRREAATALGGIGRGAHDGIPGLIHLANDPERGCQREALLAMGAILRDAAERERPAPKVGPEVAKAIERGVMWLAEHQEPEGWWEVRRAYDDQADTPAPLERARIISVASAALLAMLESGQHDRHARQLRSGLRYLLACEPPPGGEDAGVPWPWARVAAPLCAAARVLDDPECHAAARRTVQGIRAGEEPQIDAGWRAFALLEADFAGVPFDADLRRLRDVREPELKLHEKPEWRFFHARARWYASAKPDTEAKPDATGLKQNEDGSWNMPGGSWGVAHTTASMLLALEAAAGLARPLTLPLPDAPQLKAAVATLRIAAQSKDAPIKAAAEQALAGFAVR